MASEHWQQRIRNPCLCRLSKAYSGFRSGEWLSVGLSHAACGLSKGNWGTDWTVREMPPNHTYLAQNLPASAIHLCQPGVIVRETPFR